MTACEETVYCGREPSACTRPAAWRLSLEDGTDYWACESHAQNALMFRSATCTGSNDEPVELDPETGGLRAVAL